MQCCQQQPPQSADAAAAADDQAPLKRNEQPRWHAIHPGAFPFHHEQACAGCLHLERGSGMARRMRVWGCCAHVAASLQ